MYWLHVFICVSSGITPSHHVQEIYYRKSWSVWRPDSFFLFVCLLFVVNIPEEANYVINSVCWPSLALVLKEPGKLIIIINSPFFLCVTGILCCAPSCCVCIYKTSKIKRLIVHSATLWSVRVVFILLNVARLVRPSSPWPAHSPPLLLPEPGQVFVVQRRKLCVLGKKIGIFVSGRTESRPCWDGYFRW